MFDINSIKPTQHAKPPRIVLHGVEKIGKSTFFAGGTVNGKDHPGAPDAVFIQTEDGLTGVKANAFPLCNTYEEFRQQLDVLVHQEHAFKGLFIDSADWLEKLISEYICRVDNVQTIVRAGGGFGNGYAMLVTEWSQVLQILDWLNREKGMVIGLICHSAIVPFNDPEHEPYDVYKMKLYSGKNGKPGSCEMLEEWADVIGFANRSITVTRRGLDTGQKDDTGKVARAVDTSGGMNLLHLRGKPAYKAGNRYSLPETIPLNWGEFSAALEASRA